MIRIMALAPVGPKAVTLRTCSKRNNAMFVLHAGLPPSCCSSTSNAPVIICSMRAAAKKGCPACCPIHPPGPAAERSLRNAQPLQTLGALMVTPPLCVLTAFHTYVKQSAVGMGRMHMVRMQTGLYVPASYAFYTLRCTARSPGCSNPLRHYTIRMHTTLCHCVVWVPFGVFQS